MKYRCAGSEAAANSEARLDVQVHLIQILNIPPTDPLIKSPCQCIRPIDRPGQLFRAATHCDQARLMHQGRPNTETTR